MTKTVKVTYNADTLETAIITDGKPFDTSRINHKEIADWAYPFMMRKVKWNGFYDEMTEALGGEKEFNLVFEGSEEALNELKDALADAPVKVIEENNIVVIEYDAENFTVNITINGQPFDTSRINGREIEDWVYPFMVRKIKWNGIFEELAVAVGSEEYTILFSGSDTAINILMEECPESVEITKSAELTEEDDDYDETYRERYKYLCQQFEEFNEKDEFEKTIPILTELADEYDDAHAQYILALSYLYGEGTEQDDAKALKLMTASAKQGNAKAQYHMGEFYQFEDTGVKENPAESFKWYRKAAEQGDALSQCRLANCYQEGFGVEKNEKNARKWYLESAKNGEAVAQRSIAFYYISDQNYTEAVKWLFPAAEQGDTDAQFCLGICYYSGEGVSEDLDKAEKLLTSVEKEVNMAQHYLGTLNAKKGNISKAIEYWKSAGKKGVADSLFNLGMCYLMGEGVEENRHTATEYFIKSTECDFPTAEAYFPIGMEYLYGDILPKDKEKAKKMFKKGSELGDENCTEEYNKMVKREDRIETAMKIGSGIVKVLYAIGGAYLQDYIDKNTHE